MTKSQDLQTTLHRIYNEAAEVMSGLMDTQNMYIALYDKNTAIVEFPLAYQDGKLVPDEEKVAGRPWGPRRFGERNGLTEWVIQHKESLLIEKDFEGWAKAHNVNVFKMDTRCWLGAPMLLRDEVIGVIGLQNFERERIFDQQHCDLLMTIASQTGVAIENAQLFEATREIARQREERLRRLQQISQRMVEASQNPEGVLEFIARTANDIINSALTSVYLYDQATSTFTSGVSVWREGAVERIENSALPSPEDFASQIAEGQTSDFIENIADRPRVSSFAHRFHLQAFAALPLTIAGAQGLPTTMGVLFVNFKEPHVFLEDEQEILRHLANQAAVAVAFSSAQAAALAQEQLAALGTATGTLQHRLGNTINVILPAVLRLRHRVGDDATSLSILDTVERNALFAGEVIRRMQNPLRSEPFVRTNLNSLLREAIQKCIQENRYPQVSVLVDPAQSSPNDHDQPQLVITTQLDEHLPETFASVGQMTEVFRVLVENAIKAIQPNAGVITITSRLTGNALGRFAEITVSDTGKGIEEKTQQKLFKQPVPRKEFGEGAGLGLWLSQIIVRSHQGVIRLYASEPGKGSTFWLRLPILAQPLLSHAVPKGEERL
ncbi:MAG: GAF domain-containing protein [Anaerolineales bacterium]|nr:GAF domain-containing protein [Anaerolineales bacterium]